MGIKVVSQDEAEKMMSTSYEVGQQIPSQQPEKEETEEEEKLQEEQVSAWKDDEERKQNNDFRTGTRRTPLSNNILNLLGGLLQPQTEGFSQVNLDMSFSFLDNWDIAKVGNSSFLITFCKLHGFKKSEYLERSSLATLLNAKRSYQGKSMDLFTTTVTKQHQQFEDKTPKKTGFWSSLGMPKKTE